MREIRDCHRFGRRYLLLNAVSVLPFVPAFVFTWHRSSYGRFDIPFWLASGLFAAGAVLGL